MLSSDLAAGSGAQIMKTEQGNYGCIICYESIFPHLVRESVGEGAQMLVILTNDSWYEDSPAVWQHLAHAVFRSVENARSTVRCANSGVSALIDSRGRIIKELGPLEQGTVSGTLSFSEETTLYTTLGRPVLPLFFWGVCIRCVVLSVRERRCKHV